MNLMIISGNRFCLKNWHGATPWKYENGTSTEIHIVAQHKVLDKIFEVQTI